MRSILHHLLAITASLCLTACGSSPDNAAPPLRVGMIPDAGAAAASVAQKKPLETYLAQAMGQDVELIIPTNYNATVEALGNGSLDIAYLGGLTFVKAHERYGAQPLVQRTIDQKFHSVFIAHKDSGITALDDLDGKVFCFGDVNSTSGNLMPRAVMQQNGFDVAALSDIRQTGSHPATLQAVASGACDAGAMDETVYRQMISDGQAKAAQAPIFLISPPFADYVWAARDGLPASSAQRFSQALMALERGKDDRVLDILRGDSFVPANAASYQQVEATARKLGLL